MDRRRVVRQADRELVAGADQGRLARACSRHPRSLVVAQQASAGRLAQRAEDDVRLQFGIGLRAGGRGEQETRWDKKKRPAIRRTGRSRLLSLGMVVSGSNQRRLSRHHVPAAVVVPSVQLLYAPVGGAAVRFGVLLLDYRVSSVVGWPPRFWVIRGRWTPTLAVLPDEWFVGFALLYAFLDPG
jgi:hypothetical protein